MSLLTWMPECLASQPRGACGRAQKGQIIGSGGRERQRHDWSEDLSKEVERHGDLHTPFQGLLHKVQPVIHGQGLIGLLDVALHLQDQQGLVLSSAEVQGAAFPV